MNSGREVRLVHPDEGSMDYARGRRQMPKQKPGRSKQDYETPKDFLTEVKCQFRRGLTFSYDLAASTTNAKAPLYFDEKIDGLNQDWSKLDVDMWLNPPFGKIAPWAKKCSEYVGRGRIFFLTPASVGANWFAKYVWRRAHVLALNGRLSFDGIAPFPKDCMLSIFSKKPVDRFEVWSWRR